MPSLFQIAKHPRITLAMTLLFIAGITALATGQVGGVKPLGSPLRVGAPGNPGQRPDPVAQ